MLLNDFAAGSLADEIARDEAMLDAIEAGAFEALLRFWEHHCFAVVIGKGERIEECVDLDNIRSDSLEIVRRPSAGGSVVVGPGNLNIVVAATHPGGVRDIHGAFRTVQESIASALVSLGVPAAFIAPGDVAIGDRKISGTAQCSRRTGFLVHSTLLVSMDTSGLARYLAHPSREPDYRARRGHEDFVTTLHQAGYSVTPERIRRAVAKALGHRLGASGVECSAPPALLLNRAEELARLRYGLVSWTSERIDRISRRKRQ